MAEDDHETVRALDLARDVFRSNIVEQGGRVVDMAGDSVLAVFDTAAGAVQAAMKVQGQLASLAQDVPEGICLQFRVGVHLGDVIEKADGTVYGDGVNIAARLQALAQPGTVVVSQAIHNAVSPRAQAAFVDLGEQTVKNIAQPVRAFISKASRTRSETASVFNHRFRWVLNRTPWAPRRAIPIVVSIALVVVVASGGVLMAQRFARPTATPAPPARALAILWFSAPSSAPAEGQLADAVSSDLTSSLTRSMQGFPVVSSRHVGGEKGKPVDVPAIARELNARYLAEGVVRTAGERLNVKVWLTEASTRTQLWSDVLELKNAADPYERQELITRLTTQMRAALMDTERRRVLALPVSALGAEELTDRADAILQREPEPSLKVLDEARLLYDKALQLRPALPAALMSQANLLAEMLDREPHGDRDGLLRSYDEMSRRLIAAADREARAWNIRADSLQRQGRWEAALEANVSARKLDPTRLGTMGQYAEILIDMGRPGEAIAALEGTFSLQPAASMAAWFSFSRCRAKLALGRYDDAIEACEKAASAGELFSHALSVHMFLAAAYALQGNDGQAQSEKAKVLAQRPGTSIARLKASRISDVPAYLQQTAAQLYTGLLKAGIPEQ